MNEKHLEFLQKELSKFAADLKKLAENTIGEVEAGYLPFVEGDTESNIWSQTHQLITDYISGQTTHPFNSGFTCDYLPRVIRDKIWEDRKQEIIDAISADIIKENQYLRERCHYGNRGTIDLAY